MVRQEKVLPIGNSAIYRNHLYKKDYYSLIKKINEENHDEKT